MRKVRCYGPAKYLFRGSLSQEEKAAGAMSGRNERRNMLSLMTYYADRTIPVRNRPGGIVFEDVTCENVDRFLHYNYSGNETWQRAVPLADITFRNVRANGILLPLCAYGDAAVPFRLTLENVDLSFREPVKELVRGAHVEAVKADGLRVKGVEGPFFRNWSAMEPKLRFEGTGPSDQTVQAAAGEFKVRPI